MFPPYFEPTKEKGKEKRGELACFKFAEGNINMGTLFVHLAVIFQIDKLAFAPVALEGEAEGAHLNIEIFLLH